MDSYGETLSNLQRHSDLLRCPFLRRSYHVRESVNIHVFKLVTRPVR